MATRLREFRNLGVGIYTHNHSLVPRTHSQVVNVAQ